MINTRHDCSNILIRTIICILAFVGLHFESDAIFETDRLEVIRAIAWNPQGTLYAVGGGPDVCNPTGTDAFDVFVIEGTSHTVVQTLAGNECFVTSLAWNADGSRIASSSTDARIIIWDVAGPKLLDIPTGPDVSSAYSADWHPTNLNEYLVVDYSGRVLMFSQISPIDYQLIGTLDTDIIVARWEALTGDLILGHRNGLVSRWDIETNVPIANLAQHTASIIDIEINEQSQRLAAASLNGQITIVDQTSEETISTISVPTTYFVRDISWKLDGSQLAVAVDNSVQIFDAMTGQLVEQINYDNFVHSVAWSPDSSMILVGGEAINGTSNLHIAPAPIACSTTAADTPALLSAITAANTTPEADTICLDGTYTLTAANNSGLDGANGLPVITGDITLYSANGATITRSSAEPFRIAKVDVGGRLVLENITISGGTICNLGVLDMRDTTAVEECGQ